VVDVARVCVEQAGVREGDILQGHRHRWTIFLGHHHANEFQPTPSGESKTNTEHTDRGQRPPQQIPIANIVLRCQDVTSEFGRLRRAHAGANICRNIGFNNGPRTYVQSNN
jgi:hypothetical protein